MTIVNSLARSGVLYLHTVLCNYVERWVPRSLIVYSMKETESERKNTREKPSCSLLLVTIEWHFEECKEQQKRPEPTANGSVLRHKRCKCIRIARSLCCAFPLCFSSAMQCQCLLYIAHISHKLQSRNKNRIQQE